MTLRLDGMLTLCAYGRSGRVYLTGAAMLALGA
jgi:hypothetical protein